MQCFYSIVKSFFDENLFSSISIGILNFGHNVVLCVVVNLFVKILKIYLLVYWEQKIATILLVLTDGSNRFESAKELCSYVGLTPTIELWRK